MKIDRLSIVLPCHNEESNIPELIKELSLVLKPFAFTYEIIFVDDGSKDSTFKIINDISKSNKFVKGYALSRNFGHQIALLAGIENATGDVIITMDADLQHPPEIIPQLIEKYEDGYDIVNTRRKYDKKTTVFKKTSSKWFYILINKLSDIKIEPQSSDFRLMNREAVDAFLKMKEHNRFTRGLIRWIGFEQTIIDYETNERFSGQSSYSLKKMITLAIDGVTSMSSKPLRLSLYLGFIFFVSGLVYGTYVMFNYFSGINITGWTSILISILIIGGIQLLILSIIGEYVAKIFNEVKSRPLYLIKAKTHK
ncbi:glycosyltransferase family 2 protein [Seonamhaeicola sp.]|uniref:glycosyltransferase family 2 protein n=1 Tax=Seonamhaeicola sp. TaxID=1912245 RepID=UPI0026077F94|nr:glycosyltransferase family 2 protein [Seonamhaeicola sp.]